MSAFHPLRTLASWRFMWLRPTSPRYTCGMTMSRLAASMVLVISSSCVQRTDRPIANDLIDVGTPIEQVICQVRLLSASNDLRFHYGTYGSQGSLANFRLIGDGYEV